jgi:large subunit ribosomal protein L30
MPALKITLTKSLIGYKWDQGRTAQALGLRKIGTTVIRPDNAAIRGMVDKLEHVVSVETIDGDAPQPRSQARRKSAAKASE